MCRIIMLITLVICTALTISGQDNHKIVFEIQNYDNDTLIVGAYFAERQVVVDTVYREENTNKFVLEGNEPLKAGMYLTVLQPSAEYAQFMVPADDQEFTMKIDAGNLSDISFKSSDENKRFYDYLAFIKKQRESVAKINSTRDTVNLESEVNKKVQKQLDQIDQKVVAKQSEMIEKYPHTILGRLLKSNIALDVPDFEGSPDQVQMKTYLYYKEHYFDHIDLGDSVQIRMPYFHQRVDYYYNNLTPMHPDSIIQSIDYLLEGMRPAPTTYRYYLSYFYNNIVRKRVIGMDAVIVHMVDKYYSDGKAPWLSKESYDKITDNANRIRETVIGKKGKNIILKREDGTDWELYKDTAEWTVLVFWAPDCGHCTKAMPKILDFEEQYRDRGVKVIGVCTKTGKKYESCWKGVKEKKMENLLNLGDQYLKSNYKIKYDVRQTPKTYILDKDKIIRMKDVPADNLEMIMDDIIKRYKEEQGTDS